MEEKVYETTWNEEMYITEATKDLLATISRWAKFLSIIGFIFLGLGVIFVLSAGTLISGMNNYMAMNPESYYIPGTFSWMYAFIYLSILVIYFFPFYFLYKFASRTQKALRSNETHTLTEAFNSLKNHYMYIGIITIIGIFFMVLSCIMMFMGYAGTI